MNEGERKELHCTICGKHFFRVDPIGWLYKEPVCLRFQRHFASRRYIGLFIDILIFIFIIPVFFLSKLNIDPIFIRIFSFMLFVFKDSFSGYSPGKAIMGLRATKESNGKPTYFFSSFMRNIIFIVPILSYIVEFVKVFNGKRIGDELAGTKVIWMKYRKKEPFLPLEFK